MAKKQVLPSPAEISKNDTQVLKGAAILFMVSLHLFCRKNINGLYETFIEINGVPLLYYLVLFGDACLTIFCFTSGYGLFKIFERDNNVTRKNIVRIFKLLINFWIVLVMFVAIGYFAGKAELYPGSLTKFVLNFTLLSNSYNGAWWFFQTYVILVLLSSWIFRAVQKYNFVVVLLISTIVYVISYLQRFRPFIELGDNPVIGTLANAIILAAFSQLPFVVGAVFAYKNLYAKLSKKFYNLPLKNILGIITILLMVIIHAFFESAFIAPFTGIAFICIFNLMDKGIFLQKTLRFFGNHSTNIWLTHMFFYMTIFPELVFAPRYPIIIFVWLLSLSLASSYLINTIYNPSVRVVEKRMLFVFRENYLARRL